MRLILGRNLEYTCAFFESPVMTLEAAQENKIRKVIDRLQLAEGQTILDIGCGWGQVAEEISRRTKAKITAISISDEQIKFAQRSSSSDLVSFVASAFERFQPDAKYDRIYSIGMLEHVGRGRLESYFSKISSLLADNGLALIHCIVKTEAGSTNSWIDREVFPGAYIPRLSEVIHNFERSSLKVMDIYIHGSDNYFRTLSAWVDNLYRNEASLREILLANLPRRDADRILRTWEFYLQGSRLAFRDHGRSCYNVHIVVRPTPCG
ncbi:cyclopropane-fatty-acyl-phospholipid synthase family protein [Rhodopseudomonas sp. HC1]|nr:cyclopropane-fatty-acyl-phospholipid synthase family protein [Rhodopseudomonas infernalis]